MGRIVGAITLLTDFGLENAWVGIMKGVILGVNPEARIVDITHQIPPQDTTAAAWTIAAAYPYFPPGSVHVIVVDPGVGSDRKIICARRGDHLFVAPDNGVLSAVLESGIGAGDIRIVENRDLFLEPVSRTFHGRDILAPVGAHLTLSADIAATGPAVDARDLVRLELPAAVVTETGALRGTVIMVDYFGNLITNIDRAAFAALPAAGGGGQPQINAGGCRITGLSESYAQARAGRPLAIFGSMGYLEIAIFGRHAGRELNLGRGDDVTVFNPGPAAPPTG